MNVEDDPILKVFCESKISKVAIYLPPESLMSNFPLTSVPFIVGGSSVRESR